MLFQFSVVRWAAKVNNIFHSAHLVALL